MSTYAGFGGSTTEAADYASFVARHRRKPPVRHGPTAPGGAGGGPLGDPALQAILGLIGGGSAPAALSDDQIRAKAAADAQAIIGPLLAREQGDYLARLQAGVGAISGYTSTFADRVGALGPQVKQLFAGDQSLAGAFGNKLGDVQGEANMANVHSLADALKLMGAPNAKDTVGQQKQLSQGGTRVTKTLTADELQRLSTEGGAMSEYAGKLPGIAALTGGQYLRDYTTQQNNDLQDALNSINSQLPGLVTSLTGGYRDREATAQDRATNLGLNKAQLAATLYDSSASRAQTAAIFQITQADKEQAEINRYHVALANAKTAAAKAQVTADHNRIMERIAQQTADARTTTATAATTRANRPAATKDPASAAYQKAVSLATSHKQKYDSYGDPIPGTGSNYGTEYVRIANYLRGLLPGVPASTITYLTKKALAAAGYTRAPSSSPSAPPGPGSAPTVR